jgi:hypothetical protein
LRRIRGCESGAYVTQMLGEKFAYDVRHVARVLIMQMLGAPAARNKGCYFWTPQYEEKVAQRVPLYVRKGLFTSKVPVYILVFIR